MFVENLGILLPNQPIRKKLGAADLDSKKGKMASLKILLQILPKQNKSNGEEGVPRQAGPLPLRKL